MHLRARGFQTVVVMAACLAAIACEATKPVRIETSPPGANLTVDGRFVGASPVEVEFKGEGDDVRHSIVAEKPGYRRTLHLYWRKSHGDRVMITLVVEDPDSVCTIPIALKIYPSIDPAGRPLVVVAPFQRYANAKRKGLDRRVSEYVATGLVRSQRCRVMERAQLVKLIQERDLANADFGDANAREKFGKILGAEYMVLGTVSWLGGATLRIDAKLVSTKHAGVLAAEGGQCNRPEFYHNLVNRIVNKLTARVASPGSSASR